MNNNLSREQVIESRPLLTELEWRGVILKGNGAQRIAKCPLPGHPDKNPSFSVNVNTGLWHCHGCQRSGSVIDFIAFMDNRTPNDVYRQLAEKLQPVQPLTFVPPPVNDGRRFVCAYSYVDQEGKEIFQVQRFEMPDGRKTFLQFRRDKSGNLLPGLDGVVRVPYRLDEFANADQVVLCEGEKDVETLRSFGLCATTNPGGAGGWLDSYAIYFEDKDVIYCGDNDKAGAEHMAKVRKSLEGKVKSLKIIKIPPDMGKDISDWVSRDKSAEARFMEMVVNARVLPKGLDVPVTIYASISESYHRMVQATKGSVIDLGRWLPSLRRSCRPLVPGDLVTFIASTGMGKTAVLQNVMIAMLDVPQLLFQMELSEESMFERLVGHRMNITGDGVWSMYSGGIPVGINTVLQEFAKCGFCNTAFTVDQIEEVVRRSELVVGEPPKMILIDYIQLMKGGGDSRYERFSNIAEDLRRLATKLGIVIIVTCQSRRKENGESEVHLTDAKESGSIENSSSLVLGMWRDETVADSGIYDKTLIQILKNSRGAAGGIVECNWSPTFRITERSPI